MDYAQESCANTFAFGNGAQVLVRLFGKNFRSLKESFELSLVAANLTREEDRERGLVELQLSGMSEPLRLLRSVAIYGPNAAGKSTVLTAARALNWLAVESSSSSKPDGKIPPYEPFLLDDNSRTNSIELGCDFICNKSLMRYEISYGAKAIQRETLTRLRDSREEKLIDRLPTGEVRGSLITKSDANRLYVKEMQPNVAVLSKLAQHGPHRGPDSVQPFYKALRNATRHEDYSNAAGLLYATGNSKDERFTDDLAYREWIMHHLIKTADVGICDVSATREPLKIPEELREFLEKSSGGSSLPETSVVVSFVHQGQTNRQIDFSNESSGTKKLYHIAGDWWSLANESVTLLTDELSASLHPRLLDRLIRSVNEASDRVRSQLIFTTHDTGLLESQDGLPPALRRDQVYFTRKDAFGASELYSLTEFKDDARPVHNIRKRYLSGLYGALPSVEMLSL